MKYPPTSWPPSPPHWPQHSTKEIEHRLTVLETEAEADSEQIEQHDRRLNLHEKAILAIGAVLQILMQEKYPKLAELIKQVLP
jgi:hypothetical protein